MTMNESRIESGMAIEMMRVEVSERRKIRMTRKARAEPWRASDRKSTRLNSSHGYISYAVFCLKKKKAHNLTTNLYLPRIHDRTTTCRHNHHNSCNHDQSLCHPHVRLLICTDQLQYIHNAQII